MFEPYLVYLSQTLCVGARPYAFGGTSAVAKQPLSPSSLAPSSPPGALALLPRRKQQVPRGRWALPHAALFFFFPPLVG